MTHKPKSFYVSALRVHLVLTFGWPQYVPSVAANALQPDGRLLVVM